MKPVLLIIFSIGLMHAIAPVTTFLRRNSLKIGTTDTDVMVDGRVRQEYFFLNNPVTLRSDIPDAYTFFRNKANIGFSAQTGKRTFGEPNAEGLIRVTAFNYWDRPLKYTPLTEERINFNNREIRSQATITDSHTHGGSVPLIYLEEAWLRLNLDLLFVPFNDTPVSLKIGYFPYQLGRGVALGDYFEGAIPHLGWTSDGAAAGNATNYPAGLLLDIEFNESIALECYFSKMKARATCPSDLRCPIKANRLDVFPHNLDPGEIERGIGKDANIFSLKGDINLNLKKEGTFHLEPYLLFVTAPELTIETAGDASAYVNNAGLMAEFSSQQLTVNIDSSVQWGQYQVHAIDRNTLTVKNAYYNGVTEVDSTSVYQSHVVRGNTFPDNIFPAIGEKSLDSAVNLPQNRHAGGNGSTVVDATQAQLYDALYTAKSLYNADLPFAAGARFRKEYAVDLMSYMALLDVKYQVSRKVALSICGAYVSGDHYPFNSEEDKTYNGFIPFRDQNYMGHSVRSFALLYSRKIPRPSDFVDTKMYASNFSESIGNLAYIGVSGMIMPLDNPKELIIIPNAIAFWQPQAPYAWDKTATRSFPNAEHTKAYAATQSLLGFTGDAMKTHASSFLGIEYNITAVWNILENLDVIGIAAVFIPGKLYKDVDGMPNRNTRRQDFYGNLHYESLGTESIWGGNIRFTYRF